jgi:hypothetical protein
MDIQEKRRKRLQEWVSANSVPAKERSLFSQLKGGTTPFGEKLARRLEIDYRMGVGYLDGPEDGEKKADSLPAPTLKDVSEMVLLYGQLPAESRPIVLDFIRDLLADSSVRRDSSVGNNH